MKPDRLLFLDTFTDPTFTSVSSPEIGYGISCASALKSGLRRASVQVVECSPPISPRMSKLNWIYKSYARLNAHGPRSSDMVFLFSSLIHYPGEVRRLINHHTRTGCPLIGYTHGSHWDPTDSIRNASNPRLRFQDLANLLTYDRLLLVSEYYRKLLREELQSLGSALVERFDAVARVVGLPIDTDTIDHLAIQHEPRSGLGPVRIVFNHALRPPKQPEVAFSVMERVLRARDDCHFELTRALPGDLDIIALYERLTTDFPGRVRCHGTLHLLDYYRLLSQCDIQFSTASHESLGVSTIEAMYSGLACFTPARLSYPEVTRGVGCYGDLAELERLILRAVDDVAFRNNVAAAQRSCATRYRPESIATNVFSVIEEIKS